MPLGQVQVKNQPTSNGQQHYGTVAHWLDKYERSVHQLAKAQATEIIIKAHDWMPLEMMVGYLGALYSKTRDVSIADLFAAGSSETLETLIRGLWIVLVSDKCNRTGHNSPFENGGDADSFYAACGADYGDLVRRVMEAKPIPEDIAALPKEEKAPEDATDRLHAMFYNDDDEEEDED